MQNSKHWPSRVTPDHRKTMVTRTREEWRKLGFWYDYDTENRIWLFRGSLAGLRALALALRMHSDARGSDVIGEHTHLGPYMYLTVTTWTHPMIAERGIFGTREQLSSLSDLLDRKSHESMDCGFSIPIDFPSEDGSRALFFVEADDFDPASEDITIKDEPV